MIFHVCLLCRIWVKVRTFLLELITTTTRYYLLCTIFRSVATNFIPTFIFLIIIYQVLCIGVHGALGSRIISSIPTCFTTIPINCVANCAIICVIILYKTLLVYATLSYPLSLATLLLHLAIALCSCGNLGLRSGL